MRAPIIAVNWNIFTSFVCDSRSAAMIQAGIKTAYSASKSVVHLLLYLDFNIIPSLTLDRLRKVCCPLVLPGLQAFVFCIDMCCFFGFVLVACFVSLIMPRIAAFDMNSKSVLNPSIVVTA